MLGILLGISPFLPLLHSTQRPVSLCLFNHLKMPAPRTINYSAGKEVQIRVRAAGLWSCSYNPSPLGVSLRLEGMKGSRGAGEWVGVSIKWMWPWGELLEREGSLLVHTMCVPRESPPQAILQHLHAALWDIVTICAAVFPETHPIHPHCSSSNAPSFPLSWTELWCNSVILLQLIQKLRLIHNNAAAAARILTNKGGRKHYICSPVNTGV